jgi:hypothetical protein
MDHLQHPAVPRNLRRVEDIPSKVGLGPVSSHLAEGDAAGRRRARPVTDLLGLVYVSSATHWLSSAELGRLVRGARERNARLGVTGVLLYSYGNFMQYLEGPAESVGTVYEHIKASPLHAGIIELLREPIEAREFVDWSMAFKEISAFGASDPPEICDIFAGERTPAGCASPAHLLLSKFWDKGGVRRAS